MRVSFSNTKDIVATALFLVETHGTLRHVFDVIGDIEGGLSEDQLQTLSALSNAIKNMILFVLQQYIIK